MLPPTLRRSRLCTTPSGAGRAGPRCRPAAKAGQGVGTTALPETDCGTGHLGVQPGPAIPHRLPVTGARPARRPPRLGALLPSQPTLASELLSRPGAIASANRHTETSQHPARSSGFSSIRDGENGLRRGPQLCLRPPFWTAQGSGHFRAQRLAAVAALLLTFAEA